MDLSTRVIRDLVERLLDEDIGTGDLTCLAVIPPTVQARALMVFREAGVVCGMPVVAAVFAAVDPSLRVTPLVAEGATVAAKAAVLEIVGSARGILGGERVALNLIQRMSGTATLTARFVAAIHGTQARILDTRKTTPGLRVLEKYAVRIGGGTNHRFGLYDGVMLKDNHLEILALQGISLGEAVKRAQTAVGPMVQVEVEVETPAQAGAAADAGAALIMLDNMPPPAMREAVALVAGRAKLEASGGVNLETVRAIAETGVDYISVGALTHSARALDVGLDVEL